MKLLQRGLWGWALGAVLGVAAAARAQEPAAGTGLRAEMRGYVRGRAAIYSPIDGDDWNGIFRFRPELVLHVAEKLSATLTLSGERYGGRAEELLGREGDFRVERAFADYELGRFDLRAGRQAINFGSALIWNPVDLVDVNTALDFNVEKRGVDALRASCSVSSTASVLGLLAFPESGSGQSVLTLLRGEALLGSTSLGVIAAQDGRRDELVLGLDAKGDLGAGFWVEGAAHFPQDAENFYDVVLGLDYSFSMLDRLYLAAQYRRDSSGGTGVEDYDYAALLQGRSFLGRQYGSLLATLSFSEIQSVNASVVYNLEDLSYVTTLSLTRYFFENLEASARVSLLRGDGPGEFNPMEGDVLEGKLPRQTYELWLEWRF